MSKHGSNSELFAHENDALTARPQLHNMFEEPKQPTEVFPPYQSSHIKESSYCTEVTVGKNKLEKNMAKT